MLLLFRAHGASGQTRVAAFLIQLSASVSTPIAIVAAPVYAPAPYRARVVNDGAIFYLRMGEAGPPYVDLIHGTQCNARGIVTPGQPGAIRDGDAAVLFDNVDMPIDGQGFGDHSRIEVPPTPTLAALSGTAAYSQELWVKLGANLLIAGNAGRALAWRDPSQPIAGDNIPTFIELAYFDMGRITLGTDELTGAVFVEWDFGPGTSQFLTNFNEAFDDVVFTIDALNYVQIVTTFDGANGTASLFVNGQPVQSLPVGTGPATDLASTDGCVHIGADFQVNAASGWNGWIDDVSIYSRVLAADEVAAHYADRLARAVILLAASVSTPILLPGSTA